jgi:Na+-driven multidrug efflux pump
LTGKKAAIRIKRENLKPDAKITASICSLGFATFIMNITESAIAAVFNASLRDFGGDLYVTVMTIITSVSQILFMPQSGFAQGASPVIGYNYGAKQYHRVKQGFRFMLLVTALYSVAAWLITMLCPEFLVKIFNRDAALVSAAVPMFRVYFAANFIMCLQMCAQNTFVAVGDAKWATFFAIYRKLILLIPLIFILPRIGLGLVGVFAAEPIADTISAVTCFTTFMLTKYRKWEKEMHS